ncbi:MAG: hypothetical protein FWF50_05605 [Defluviitaleaceae bacterium]|nr:hypothetical protein [Defluviitaleaceae bacterium]
MHYYKKLKLFIGIQFKKITKEFTEFTMIEAGKIVKISKIITVQTNLNVSIGDIVYIKAFPAIDGTSMGVITAISNGFFDFRPFFDITGLYFGKPVYTLGEQFKITIGDNILGNILDGFGNSLIGKDIDGDKYEIYTKNNTQLKEPTEQLITGQRVIDSFFPIYKGESTAIPGGFGTGKTQLLHQIAKNSNVDIVVYIGCGERGNEIAALAENFTKLDIMKKTTIVATTSDDIVTLREQGIYIGLKIAEYFSEHRDVLVIIDSLSRFAEALRELMGNEIPVEEGYPSYLEARLCDVLERSFASEKGSLSIVASISPQGSDTEDYVTGIIKNIAPNLIELDKNLAYARHFPAVNYLKSYSKNSKKNAVLDILQKEEEVLEIVSLIGKEVLHDNMKLVLKMAEAIKQGFLQQNLYHIYDSFSPLHFQKLFLNYIILVYTKALELIEREIPIRILEEEGFFKEVYCIKESPPEDFLEHKSKIKKIYRSVLEKYEE